MSNLKCPVPGCNNEVDIIVKDGELWWIDPIIPTHKGKVNDLKSPEKEMFEGYAYEKGLLNTSSQNTNSMVQYTTQNLTTQVQKANELPVESIFLFVVGVAYFIFSFLPVNVFSSPLLYILGIFFVLLSVIEYFVLY